MVIPSRLSQWRWPGWIREIASLPPNPDGLAGKSSPDALDWILHGLPSGPVYDNGTIIVRGLGGLGTIPVFPDRYAFPHAPAWQEGELMEARIAPDFSALSADQRLEIAFLVLMCRGADPWSWGCPVTGRSSVKAPRLLGELFARRLLVAARAMLDHSSCPSQAGIMEFMVKVQESGEGSRKLPLGSGLALVNDLRGLDVLLKNKGWLPGITGKSILASARSREVAEKLLEREEIRAYDVFMALYSWMSRSRSAPDSPSSIPGVARDDLVLEAGKWWERKGLGDQRQWGAQVACLKAIACAPFSGSGPVGMDEWLREVGSYSGNIWVSDSRKNNSRAGSSQSIFLHGMVALPASTVHAWLVDRSQTVSLWGEAPGHKVSGEPWYWQDRIGRLETWKRLEMGLGKVGNIQEWEKAWGRFWSWAPRLSEWTKEDAKKAARLWKMEHSPWHWPPPGWNLDEMGPRVLNDLPPAVKQIIGEAFLLSVVDGAAVREDMRHLTTGMGAKKWFRVHMRIRWLRAWLETPGWKVPALTDARRRVLSFWPTGKRDDSPEELALMWSTREMDEALQGPSLSCFRPRL